MKNVRYVSLLVTVMLSVCCSREDDSGIPKVKNPISVMSPTPENTITRVSLSPEQATYANYGNSFAINTLKTLYSQNKGNMVVSPLSLQYALGMAVNGASGATAEELLKVLGVPDVESLNDYCHLLLNQLPALDKDVAIRLTDVALVKDGVEILDGYRSALENSFYAPLEYISDRGTTLDRINEWAYRCTDGFIYPFLQEEDLSEDPLLILLNALYFKAPWQGSEKESMFKAEATLKSKPFYIGGSNVTQVDYLVSAKHYRYGRLDDNGIVEIPYAGGKFALYVILPDERYGLEKLVLNLEEESLRAAMNSMTSEAKVSLRLPKFEIEKKYDLRDALSKLGISKVFAGNGEFDRMVKNNDALRIDKLLQKARIQLTEWGTEAGAVTAVEMVDTYYPDGGERPQIIDFHADHPFVFFIAEKTSGVILFEGAFAGI